VKGGYRGADVTERAIEAFVRERPRRVRIEAIQPVLDGGRYPVKRIAGDEVEVFADLVADGHDELGGVVAFRHAREPGWQTVPLASAGNDRWRARFTVSELGTYRFAIEAWIDAFATWRHALDKKLRAGVDVRIDLLSGAALVEAALGRSGGDEVLAAAARLLGATQRPSSERIACAFDEELAARMRAHPDRAATARSPEFAIRVDRERARFSAWYELFPRSFGKNGAHGTFRDAEAMLPYVADLGFDVVYLPPIHPIGRTRRKGPNNRLEAAPGDPGSPWAVGAREGGHTAIHRQLGNDEDFAHFVAAAAQQGLEVALDIALQASPDHPWVLEHAEWFRAAPDGTIQCAENPPKRYEDIYPLDFETPEWRALWQALYEVFDHWIARGVRVFRVDNPHTKSLAFWEWCIATIVERHPDVVFLSEAFTRPKLMYALAKVGFSQSYTYFTWRTHAGELRDYMHELVHTPVAEFFRPNFWPNTPDILPPHLQGGERAAFVVRFALAALLSANFGIYGPAFELGEHVPRPGSDEYLDNEKYQLRRWNLADPRSLAPFIRRINRIRRAHPALQRNDGYAWHPTDNGALFAFSKRRAGDVVLVVINLDTRQRQSGHVELDLGALGLDGGASFRVHDLVGDAIYEWHGARNYVDLDPHVMPVHVFSIG
jgi:starch synthase (maltosyl-transferring)